MPKIKYPDKWICITTCYCNPLDGLGERYIERGEVVTCKELPNHHFEQYYDSTHERITAEKWGTKPHWVIDKEIDCRGRVLELPENLGIDLSEEQLTKFEQAVHFLIAESTQFSSPPRNPAIVYMLEKLSAACKESLGRGELTSMYQDSLKDFIAPQMHRILNLGSNWPRVRDGGIEVVGTLKKAADKALIEIKKKKGGRPEKNLINYFTKSVSDVYLQGTGRVGLTWDEYTETYKGELFVLIKSSLNLLNIEYISDKALFKAIQRNK